MIEQWIYNQSRRLVYGYRINPSNKPTKRFLLVITIPQSVNQRQCSAIPAISSVEWQITNIPWSVDSELPTTTRVAFSFIPDFKRIVYTDTSSELLIIHKTYVFLVLQLFLVKKEMNGRFISKAKHWTYV